MEPVLKVRNLRTQFVTMSGLARVLDGISFEVMPGEVMGLVGETGSGKSVTALSVMNLIPETQGAVVEGDITLMDYDLASTQKKACTIKQTRRGYKLKVQRKYVKENSRKMTNIRGKEVAMIFQEPMTTLNPILSIKRQFEDALFAHQTNNLAARIIARREITKEQLNEITEHTVYLKEQDYLDEFVKNNPGLSAIKEQVAYIVERHDLNSFKKRLLIADLYGENRNVSGTLKRYSEKKFKKPPLRPSKEIREEAKRLMIELLTKMNIPDSEKVINQYPHELSGGMRQRVVIAIAISSSPKILIADEPTTALDVTIQAQILDVMKEMKRTVNTSVLFITHDLGVISEITDKITVMYAGSIVETGKSVDIFRDPKHPYTVGLLSSIPPFTGEKRRLKSIPGSVPSPMQEPEGCKFHSRCSFTTDVCSKKIPPMEDLGEGHKVACWLYTNE